MPSLQARDIGRGEYIDPFNIVEFNSRDFNRHAFRFFVNKSWWWWWGYERVDTPLTAFILWRLLGASDDRYIQVAKSQMDLDRRYVG